MDIVTRTISSSKSLLHFFRLYPEMPISTHTFPRRPTNVIRSNGVGSCLDDLFRGPEEVQAIAFLALVNLRLTAANDAGTGPADVAEA